ncbi:Ferrous-iron efflux pump FieF [bacterium HR19]|nr:Ferrous-iron efflux pump FieF [bacterium HR19]
MLLRFIFLIYILTTVFKILSGLISGNNALFSDGVDSLKNLMTLFLSAFFFNLSQEEADRTHHWGHKKYDAFGSLIISVFQIFISGVTATYVILNFRKVPEEVSLKYSVASLLMMTIIIILFALYIRDKKSSAMRSEFLHEAIDLLQTFFVVISTYLSLKLLPEINSIFSLLICVLLFLNGAIGIFRVEKFLVDRAPSQELISKIKEFVLEDNNDISVRELKTSFSSERTIRLELVIQIDGRFSLQEAHAIAHQIEQNLRRKMKEINLEVENCSIHFEPKGAHLAGES